MFSHYPPMTTNFYANGFCRSESTDFKRRRKRKNRGCKENDPYGDSPKRRDQHQDSYHNAKRRSRSRSQNNKRRKRHTRHRYRERTETSLSSYVSSSRESSLSRSRSTSSVGHASVYDYKIEADSEGHFVYRKGYVLGDWKLIRTLGEGTFGRVVEMENLRESSNRRYAVKIIRSIEKYRDAASYEIKVLEVLKDYDKDFRFNIVHFYDWFNFHGHMCLVFEMLGESVFDFMRHNGDSPYPLAHVRHISYQLCRAVRFLHHLGIAHTDLKPENIMFVNASWELSYDSVQKRKIRKLCDTRIKLIDFGSSVFRWEHHTRIVCTRHYRPPEVILELGWDEMIDNWSIGCIVFEIYTGVTLYQTHDSLEHLAMIDRSVGPIPVEMMKRSPKRKFFTKNNELYWDWHSSDGRYVRSHVKPLKRYMLSRAREHEELFDVLFGLLEMSPHRRMSLASAMRMRFFDGLPSHQRPPTTGLLERMRPPSPSLSRSASPGTDLSR